MMLFRVLVITVFCALTVAFPRSELVSINKELQDSIIGLLNSVFDQLGSYGGIQAPLENYTDDYYLSTDSEQTTSFMPARNKQNSEFSTGIEIVSSGFLEEFTENTEITEKLPLAGTNNPVSPIS
ncbi:kidney androgen-regulated protein-like [Mus caroli]|uniref:Kidney androgen-regulated protein-like n=1 Tax=Mus caroli TaxID=10089 RepID=A0A6P5PWY7_MUSCR|nr:kidney androgen-regulated protein-like [Mus caroli]